jgi:hypothetical protein
MPHTHHTAQSRQGVSAPGSTGCPEALVSNSAQERVRTTLTLHESYTQFPVGTSKEGPPGDNQRAYRRDVAEGTKVPHDGPAKVTVRLDAGRYKGVARVQMAGMHPVLIPVTQSGSRVSRLGGGGNVGRAARMNHGGIQQGGTMVPGRVTSTSARAP